MNIPVTKPFLPPYEDYERYLKGIWQRGWLTNHGPLVNELELRLKDHLGLDHLLFLANGTIALQIAIRALALQGEIITTPFSYVATTASIVWEHAQPVMVDICPRSLNLDPLKVEAAITPRTCAILATHVFGNPCETEALESIARRHGLKIIYDAAHGFGTLHRGRSLLSFGDIATCSFHATKLFHTGEGGAVCTADPELLRKLALLRNFGHTSQTEFDGIGINGKNSEFHAAMGLANLPHLTQILASRKQLSLLYREGLKNIPVTFQEIQEGTEYNHAYCPVLFEDEATVERIQRVLNQNAIFPRRYFYPSLSTLSYVGRQNTPIAEDIAPRILCLPMFHGLSPEEVAMVCRLIKRTIRYPG